MAVNRCAKIKGDAAKVNTTFTPPLLLRKQTGGARLHRHSLVRAVMDLWSDFHVLLSIALFAALIAHGRRVLLR